MTQHLPEHFIQTIKSVHREKGEAWLEQFPALLASLGEQWGVTVEKSYTLSYNYVASVRMQSGEGAVLKLCVPGNEFSTELAALQAYKGNGICRLLAASPEQGAMLLEQLTPGHTLIGVEDQQATRIAASVIKRLHIPAPVGSDFRTLESWARGFGRLRQHFAGGTGPLPAELVQKAERTYEQLFATRQAPLVLLHGDLHHENILAAQREPWLAIDPKGVIGEREFEVVPFLLNQWPAAQAEQTIRDRVAIFVQELGLARERVLAWAFCHGMLAAWWHVEDRVGSAEAVLQKAQLFARLLEEEGEFA